MTPPTRTSVLVVDKEEAVRAMLQAALVHEEYDVVSAARDTTPLAGHHHDRFDRHPGPGERRGRFARRRA
jgi:CheY-like chemotaxis protein